MYILCKTAPLDIQTPTSGQLLRQRGRLQVPVTSYRELLWDSGCITLVASAQHLQIWKMMMKRLVIQIHDLISDDIIG
jgi:hypothetical protein